LEGFLKVPSAKTFSYVVPVLYIELRFGVELRFGIKNIVVYAGISAFSGVQSEEQINI
jgi:hypothetical protein